MFNSFEINKNYAVLLKQFKKTKKSLAKCQEKNNRLEYELDQNRSLMAQILSCQIKAKNKERENLNFVNKRNFNHLDEQIVGIKNFDSLMWNPLIELLEFEKVDIFIQIPPLLIPRPLVDKCGLIPQIIFKSLISLTIQNNPQTSTSSPFFIILLPNIKIANRYLNYLSDEAVNILFTKGISSDMVCLSYSSIYPTFCLTTCDHLLIEFINENNLILLENLTFLLLDEADFLVHDVDFVQCFLEIKSRSPQSYRTLMFSRTFDNQINHSSTFSENNEARLIDFDEDNSISLNELETSKNKQSIEEINNNNYEHKLLLENNLDIQHEEENNISETNYELSQSSEINKDINEQNIIENKDYWPIEFMDIRPLLPPSIIPVYIENDEQNLNQNKISKENNIKLQHNYSTIFEEDQHLNLFEEENIEEQEGNNLLINFDQRQSISTIEDIYQSCLTSLNNGSTNSSTNISNLSVNNCHLNKNCLPIEEQLSNKSLLPHLRISSSFPSSPFIVQQNSLSNLSEPVLFHQSAFTHLNSQESILSNNLQQNNGEIQSKIQLLEQRIEHLEQQNVNSYNDQSISLDIRLNNIEDRLDKLSEIEKNFNQINNLEIQNKNINQLPNKNNNLIKYLNTLGQLNSNGELILRKCFNYTENFKELIFVGNSLNIKGIVISSTCHFKIPSLDFIDEIIEYSILSINCNEMIQWLVINFTSLNRLDWPKNLLFIDTFNNSNQPSTSSQYFKENSTSNIKKRQIKSNKVIYTLRNVHSNNKFVVELYFESKNEIYKKAHALKKTVKPIFEE
ncbi:hypothetical protein Mgra_00002460 [Meloidogyne graminicola]|uniref:Helicase ATP-binding domain-containing protein n=1 Tax=Meloidogyne graminicola TaxID=189291 RepID=A0A8S9ZWL1_9BILA|nr:hypothetical protein Mgra_00002460 [Meloidogyne graminicola]